MVGEHRGNRVKAWKRKAREIKHPVEVEKLQDANKHKLSQIGLDNFSGDESKKGRMSEDHILTESVAVVVQPRRTP